MATYAPSRRTLSVTTPGGTTFTRTTERAYTAVSYFRDVDTGREGVLGWHETARAAGDKAWARTRKSSGLTTYHVAILPREGK